MAPLAPNSLVVITGLTGYIASHTGLFALKTGYRVRGTIRSLAKADELRKAYEKEDVDVSAEKLEFVTVDDLLSADQFEAAFRGADAVIHIALPHPTGGDFVQQMIDSVLVPLKAAEKVGIKQFVLTGTGLSILSAGEVPPTMVTDKDWNEESIKQYENATEEEKKSPHWIFSLFAVGKQLAERAAWKYVETDKPSFELTVVLPELNWGPVLYGKEALTPSWVTNLLRGDASGMRSPARRFVDVRDCARLHVLALSDPSLMGRRIWAAGGPFNWNEVLSILRRNFPAHADEIPANIPGKPHELDPWNIDNARGTKALGSWIILEKSVVDTAKSVGF
ncbi:NAD(P)-binding protein [Calocera viscosa TUFC12733]|uniref:NAD(P)-binding protein n=1 Tax=Calocera viscosa (strain TUFC12733) TaxID=1330018 RepID=A0A167JV05_CALVF|nr:NAD(P)-binding protein [Calocera viscosa TUFC12733]